MQSNLGFLVSWRGIGGGGVPTPRRDVEYHDMGTLPEPGSENFMQLTFIELAFSTFNVFLSVILSLFSSLLSGLWQLILPP